jgi:2-oxoglutarate ferredoxin oxidoreductase subunit gamma
MERYEVKIVGVGGQGIRIAGAILGMAATIDGKVATHWQSYGVETRGGPSTSDIVISSEKIDYPRVMAADALVALDQMMLNEHLDDLKPGGILIIDPDLIGDRPLRKDVLIKQVPMARIADSLGQRLLINMIMLGVLTETARIVSKDAMVKAITANVPADSREINIKAFELGIKLAEEVK